MVAEIIDWSVIFKELEMLSRFISWLCNTTGPKEQISSAEEVKSIWDVVLHPNTPRQTNMSDCGIMTVKFIECLVSGRDVSIIDPQRRAF